MQSGFHLEHFIRGEVLIMKGRHDQMKCRCGFYSKLRGWLKKLGGGEEVGELRGEGESSPLPQ